MRPGIECLESRKLLAAHLPAVVVGVSDSAATGTASCTASENATNTAAAGDDQDAQTMSAASSAPVQRLTSGSQFHGYDYIPADGSTPPPPMLVPPPDLTGTPVRITQVPAGAVPGTNAGATTGKGKAAKPSIVPGDVGADAAGLPPTPLAQTPAGPSAGGSKGFTGRPALAVPDPGHVIAPAANATAATQATGHLPTIDLPIAFIDGAPTAVVASDGIVVAVEGGTVKMAEGLAYASNHAADALSLLSSGQTLAGTAAYNFVHFNPGNLLNDAIASFTTESASLMNGPAAAASRSPARAWLVTASVVGADLMLVGYWYHKRRKQQKAAALAAAALAAVEP